MNKILLKSQTLEELHSIYEQIVYQINTGVDVAKNKKLLKNRWRPLKEQN